MNAVAFQEIDRFNAYAQANAASVAQLLADVKSLDDIVHVANGLEFNFSLGDVQQYIQEKTKETLTEEQLAMIAGGSSWSWTFSWSSVWTLSYGVVQVVAAAEIAAVVVLVVDAAA